MHFISCDHAESEIKIINRPDFRKKPFSQGILDHIDFYEILEHPASDVADDICLSYLTCAVDEKNLFGAGLQMSLNHTFNFTIEHKNTSFKARFHSE